METLLEQREEDRREKENIEEEGEEAKILIVESQSSLPGPSTVGRYQTGGNSDVSGAL